LAQVMATISPVTICNVDAVLIQIGDEFLHRLVPRSLCDDRVLVAPGTTGRLEQCNCHCKSAHELFLLGSGAFSHALVRSGHPFASVPADVMWGEQER
jgi:hypothetical protein